MKKFPVSQYDAYIICTRSEKLRDMLRSKAAKIQYIHAVIRASTIVTSTARENYNAENFGGNNATTAFTTSSTLKLLNMMERLLCFDASRIIFMQKPRQWAPLTRNILGSWNNQLGEGEPDIVLFCPVILQYVQWNKLLINNRLHICKCHRTSTFNISHIGC